MTTIYNWFFALLVVFAIFGLLSILVIIYFLVIEPIREMACNYKRYKKFYIEEHEKIGIEELLKQTKDDEVEEDVR